MEEPVQLNLWGRVVPDRREHALAVIRKQSVFPSEIELRKAISSAVQEGRQMQISSALGYKEVNELAASIGDIFSDLTLCQEGYGPTGGKAFCPTHNFHFGGCLGCHICQGFYRE
jgi:hypothetical protein